MTGLEEWRPIAGYDGFYFVSNRGRVASTRPHRGDSGTRELSGSILGGMHRFVRLSRTGGPSVKRYVHQLVAEAFIGPRPDGLVVRHLDGDPLNNTVGNLRYGTHRENELDTVRHGNHQHARKTHCPQGHPYDEVNTWTSLTNPKAGRQCRACKRRTQGVAA